MTRPGTLPSNPNSARPTGAVSFAALERAYEQSHEAILVTDADNRIIAANPAFCRLSGLARDELLDTNPDTPVLPQLQAAIRASLQSEDFWEGEIHDQSKGGTRFTRWLKLTAIRGEDGYICNYVANLSDLDSDKEVADRLAYLAYHDPLTNLPNRLAFEAQLAQALRLCERDNHQLALMVIDLDNFKNINDSLGHHFGDDLLQQVAHRLRECVRSSDLVARLGGDEFVVVLPEIETPLTAARVASKVQVNLGDSYRVGEHVLYATPSIGISLFPIDGLDPNTLLRNADTAMYHAKNAGRNNHQFYTARMNEAAGERLQMENELRQAVSGIAPGHCEFSLHFQPQIQTATGKVIGLEALLRWDNSTFGRVSPMRFIAIAEDTGLILPLGDWVIWETCRLTRSLKDQGMDDVRVAINISAQQLRHDNLLLLIRGALACYDLSPRDIELEITESTAMQNPEVTLSILDQLAAMGIMLAIDDFGTGYSSLAYLKHLPINRLKLDRSFVTDIETDANDAAICTATIALGHSLGLELVAEGVETEEQRDFLARLGCDTLQGYLYSKPMPFADVVAYLQSHQIPIE
ncbi:MAG: EAL domain-containing protein [Betaproteobacteria bacterium]|nr:EAL domain-containing protein [Betaproteobacteria bacterium]